MQEMRKNSIAYFPLWQMTTTCSVGERKSLLLLRPEQNLVLVFRSPLSLFALSSFLFLSHKCIFSGKTGGGGRERPNSFIVAVEGKCRPTTFRDSINCRIIIVSSSGFLNLLIALYIENVLQILARST